MTENYYDNEEFREILNSYEESEKMGRSRFFDSDDLLDIADYYCIHGKVAKARAMVDDVIETFTDADDALLMKSRMQLTYDHDPDGAEKTMDCVADKDNIDYIYIKAEIMLTRKQDNEAEKLLQQVYSREEEEKEEIAEEVARIYADYNCLGMAEAWLEKSGNKESDQKKEIKAMILINKGKLEESQEILNQLIDNDPYETAYWNLLAKAQLMSGNIEDSIISSEYSLAINPNDDEAVLNKGSALYQLGNYDEAIRYFKHFTALRPDEEGGEMMLGIAMIAQNRLQEGVEHLKEAEKKISIDSRNVGDIYRELTVALCHLGHYDEALAYLDRSEKAEWSHTDRDVMRGLVLMSKGEYEKGQKCYEKALKDSGYSAQTYLKIGMALYESRLYVSAYLTTKSLLDICGDELPEAYAYHALFCLYTDNEKEYMEYRKIAFEKTPHTAEMLLGNIKPEKE
ncbi:tetratricopeptide repeat protein [Prevotella sp. OH937_COT-195]|uniref:tetratricopeptide repeat protein n=1 Tax=Prevotella sp. OH937_COT-195 TaxID=2491051 RepID=UPI000F6542A2|nr:tetratricopeptide repeat protein [Prevotella sp. OH937_COT-195]RRD02934.1 tetratricopeptide repeat protein [Prevotella sp. OH937_COT-195]